MPNLTLEDAIKEFPEECELLVPKATWPLSKDEDGVVQLFMDADLAYAALQWLAGKRSFFKRLPGRRNVTWQWPPDPLRWLLEEVHEQLKLETPK